MAETVPAGGSSLEGLRSRVARVEPIWFIALGYLILQLLVMPMKRWWSFDEAIYVSQVTRGVVPSILEPWRFRGVSLIVAPVALFGSPAFLIRLWLATLSSVGLALAFGLWVRHVGGTARIAAGVFATSWLAVFYGSEAMPNIWSALGGVAATALAVRRDRRGVLSASAVLFAMSLIRVPDAVLLGAALAVFLLVRGDDLRHALSLVGAVAAGVAVWLVDIAVRFGIRDGIEIALESQQSDRYVTISGGVADRALAYVSWIGSNVPPRVFSPSLWSRLWWVLLLTAATVGVLRGRIRQLAPAFFGGMLLIAAYLFLLGPIVPRYLLPGLALLTLPAAHGLRRVGAFLGEGASWLHDAAAMGLALLVLSNLGGVLEVVDEVVASRSVHRTLGLLVEQAVDPGPCLVLVSGNAPAIGMASRCAVRFYARKADAYAGQSLEGIVDADAALARGEGVYYLGIWSADAPAGFAVEQIRSFGVFPFYRLRVPTRALGVGSIAVAAPRRSWP